MSCTTHHHACECREAAHQKEVDGLRAYHDSKDRLWRKAVCERADRTRERDQALAALRAVAAEAIRCNTAEPQQFFITGWSMDLVRAALEQVPDRSAK